MATMKMSGCLALVAKMPEADQDALLARVDQYQADGIPAERAQVMAANDVLAEIRAERSQLMSAIAEQHPDLLTVSEAPAAQLSRRRNALGLYSALTASVEDIKTNTAPAAGWRDAIKGLVNKGQVKADEVEWSGVNDWLALQQGKVTREQVADYLKQGGVQVEETVLGGRLMGKAADDALYAWVNENGSVESPQYNPEWQEFYDSVLGGDTSEETLAIARRIGVTGIPMDLIQGAYDGFLPEGPAQPKYDRYQLPGGENYREVLLTLPMVPSSEAAAWIKAWGEKNGLTPKMARLAVLDHFKLPDGDGPLSRSEEIEFSSLIRGFQSSHWDQANVLAHIRVNDRTDADGNKVLFVEEIQSDWGQEGKKKGFSDDAKVNRLRTELKAARAAEADALSDALAANDSNSDAANEALKAAEQKTREAARAVDAETRRTASMIPVAPFVTKTEGWLNLALKRVLTMAVEGGYDKVAFVNGEQSADRYDLSKQIDKVVLVQDSILIASKDGQEVFRKEGVKPEDLPDYIGKDPAEKLLAAPEKKNLSGTPTRTITGLDLKVGGEGMKTFYDTIVPTALKKLLPKVGGGKAGTIEMVRPNASRRDEILAEIEAEEGKPRARTSRLVQPGFDITPAMREKVGEGLPMFSRQRQPDTPEFKRWFGDSKVVNGLGQPRVVYHGTASDFSIFDINQAGKTYRKPEERGFFFTGRLETAESAADDATGLPIYARKYANQGFGGGMDRGDAYDNYDDGEAYDSTADYNGGQNIMPVYLSIQNPLIVDAREGNGAGSEFENGPESPEQMIERAKREGHDGIIIRGKYRNYESLQRIRNNSWMSEEQKRSALDKLAREDARKRRTDNYFIAFRSDQIKSAIGNVGAYGQRPVTDEEANQLGMGGADAQYRQYEGDISLSRQRIVGESKRAYTPEQLQYFENVGRTVTTPTLKERIAELRKDLGKKMAQGIADQFRPISDLGQKAYALARLSRGSSGAFEALLHHGKLSLKDGVYDADQSGGFIERVGVPLQGELEDFLWWVAANRAERLTAEDRERLFTANDIAAGKSLDQGTADFDYVLQHGPRGGQTTRDRTLIFRDALKTFDEFNKNTLDMAEQSGLIDGASRKIWEHEFYVPFYRVAEEGNEGFSGAAIKNSLVRQEAFKKLKGGKEKLNSDLLANTLANWGHLIDAASKNRAAKETLEAAANLGAAVEADEATIKAMATAAGKKNQRTWFMDGGVKRHFLIEDQAVVTALTSLDYAGLRGPLWDALTAPKHWLTIGVTASPHFKIKNLIRDSVQAIATSELSYNPVKNIAEGVRASDRNSQTYVSALASGGLIRFGTMLEGSTSKRTRQLINMGVKDATILDSDNKVQAMYDKFLEPMVMAYNEIGNRGEEINRASLFKQLTDQGVDQAQAALMARDLMDFSMQGSWTWVRVLTQVVPFLNARIQGMYKLGRSAVDDPKRFGIVLGAVAAASVSLLLAYEDDDDWKKREDWDRDTYWWFKVGGTAFRIPKPFEIGAIGTLAERGLEYFMSPEMTNKRFRKVVSGLILDQLSMNPVPQVFKPLLDLYSNKDSFTGRPIETMGMEKVKPQYRFTDRTSMLARGLSTGTFGALSPVQYDHIVRGYFAWLGSMVVSATDVVLRPLTGQGERATPDYWKLATGGLVAGTESASSRYVSQMYEQAKELEQAMGTYRMLMKTGRTEEGREFFKDNKQDIVKSAAVERVKAAESRYNEMIRMIERSKLDPDVKRERIQAVQVQKDKIARLVAPGYAR